MAIFSKPTVPRFAVDVYQNEYLPEGGREVNAVVTVSATGGGTIGGAVGAPHLYSPGRGPAAAVALMVDCSGSMDYPPTKMRNAREATAAAVDTLRDGVHFAVIGGTHVAKEVYPGGGRLAVASEATRAAATYALRRLSAGGGTAIGTWLRLADRLLSSADVTIRHGILLTDGRNEHETPEALRSALDGCAGRFTCDARGVGTDWEVKEVTQIASALLGTADIVADPAGLAADFTAMMETAMGKEVADVALRLWTPVGTTVRFVKQVAPSVEDLTDRRSEAGPRTGDYPTGSWGDESRDYHVCLEVPPAGIGQEMLAARVSLVVPPPGEVRPRTWAPRASYGRCGRTTWRPPPGSTPKSPTTRARPNSPMSSRRGSTFAKRAIWTERPRNWGGRCSSPASRGTRILRNCLRRWWTWSTRRQVLCDSRRRSRRRTK